MRMRHSNRCSRHWDWRTRRGDVLAWSGRTLALLLLLAVFIVRLQPGNAWAQMNWALAFWTKPSPAPTQTASVPGQPTVPADLPAPVQSFIVLALPFALQAHQQLGWQTSVVLAQWGLEHGWHVPDAQGYNWGNTTYAPGCPKHGRFCYASSPAEGLREYVYTAQLHFYDGVRAAVPRGADAVAVALGESLWDEGHYGGAAHPGASLLKLLHTYDLYRFDQEND
jgi:hypothetical protein